MERESSVIEWPRTPAPCPKIDLSKEDLDQINALLEEAGDLPVFGGSKILK